MSHDNMTVTEQHYGELTMKAGCSRPPEMVPPFFFTSSAMMMLLFFLLSLSLL